MTELPRLTSAEAAARLGVRVETLYAYVSRGLITRSRGTAGSTFDPLEVERLAAGRRGRGVLAVQRGTQTGTPLMILDTDLALIEDGRLYLRGRDIAGLADRRYEELCGWIWVGEQNAEAFAAEAFVPDPASVATAVAVLDRMPPGTSMIDLIMVATRVFAARDPLRHDLSEGRVTRSAAALLAGLVTSLPSGSSGVPDRDRDHRQRRSFAEQLWPRLTSRRATRARIGLLNAALVVLFDHDLATSTLAARAAASARADPYGVISAGLATLDSALHGSASADAYRLLSAMVDGKPVERALAEALRGRSGIPGFGHRLYSERDPRAIVLLDRLSTLPGTKRLLALADEVIDEVARRSGLHPNIDFALALLALATGMSAEAGEVIFACSRVGGWIAHALDEYTRPPVRLRPTGRYVGP